MRRTVLAAAAVMMLTTACRAEANLLLDVAEDGSGTVTAEMGLDDELLGLMEEAGGGVEDLFDLAPQGDDVTTRREGDMTFYSLEETFTDTEDLTQRAQLFGADATFADLELVVADGGAELKARIEAPDSTETLEGLGGDALGSLGGDVLSASLIVDLPGQLVTSNADEVLPDGRLKWSIPVFGGTLDIQATTRAGGGGPSIGLILAVVAAVFVIGGAAVWSQRRRRESVTAIEAVEPPPAPVAVFDQSATAEVLHQPASADVPPADTAD